MKLTLTQLEFAFLIVFVLLGTPVVDSVEAQQPERLVSRPMFDGSRATATAFQPRFANSLSTLVIKTARSRTTTISVLPQDEIWLLNARNSHHDRSDLSKLCVQRLVAGEWVDDELANLVAAHTLDKSKATMIYNHGNRTNENWAIWRALGLYHDVFGNNGNCRPPIRYVIWEWRSEPDDGCRAIREYTSKSRRSVVLGEAMANVLGQFPDRHMALVGFSLGAQTVLAALDQPTCGSSIYFSRAGEVAGQYRVVLIAPAIDGQFVARQRCRYPDQSAVARSVVFDNQVDLALRVSTLIRRKQAVGGDVPISTLAARGNLPLGQVNVCDISAEVGRRHSQVEYWSSATVRRCLNQMLSEVFAESHSVIVESNSGIVESNSGIVESNSGIVE